MTAKDQKTIDYFDNNTPEYSLDRFEKIVGMINERNLEGANLLDVGCGTGNVLEYFVQNTSLDSVVGMDVSSRYLSSTSERINCETYEHSILESGLSAKIPSKFDYIVIGAVLHHLIGSSRTNSASLAEQALANCRDLLKPDGWLIILEPIFYPKLSMDLVYWVKKIVTKFTTRRIELFDKWNNIGEPVVSYYDVESLTGMINRIGLDVVFEDTVDFEVNLMLRAALINRKCVTTIVSKRVSDLS